MKEFLTLALSLAMPILVSWLKTSGWSDWAKVLLSLGVSLVFGVLIAAIDGGLDPRTIGASAATVFTIATAFYKMYFQATEMNRRLESKPQ